MSTIRTWTLTGSHPDRVLERIDPRVDPGESIDVLEADPVLDLLERAYLSLRSQGMPDSCPLGREMPALLRAHGRLGGET